MDLNFYIGGFGMSIKNAALSMTSKEKKRKDLRTRIIYHRQIYLFLLFPFIWYLVFHYYPMYGALLAFKNFKYNLGIIGSPWAGLKYFKAFLSDSSFYEVIRNTLTISLLKLLFNFPAPIIMALMINEIIHDKFKRIVQTISYLPHFVSWVVVVTLLQKILSPNAGLINDIRVERGLEPIFYMGSTTLFYPLVILTSMWKGIGWNSIIYLAALTNIDPNLYEAAYIDGAGRWSLLFKITLPCLVPTIAILLIMSLSGILNAGFDQIYLMQTPSTLSVSEILDTYVLKTGILEGQFSYSTAIGFFKSIISMILIVTVNWISRKLSDISLW